ncbi:hypothetical protein HX747_30690 [Streptomyces sp. L06]|nr:hypothetical protein [Streptomyces sp. L06]
MASKTASRRKRKAAQAPKTTPPRTNGQTRKPSTPSATAFVQAAVEQTGVLVHPEAASALADAADRAADIRDRAADVRDLATDAAAQLLAHSEARAAELLSAARSQAASITEAASTEQGRILADAQCAADRLRADTEEQATQLMAETRHQADATTAAADAEATQLHADAQADAERQLAEAAVAATEIEDQARAQARQIADAARIESDEVLEHANAKAAEILDAARRVARDADEQLEAAEERVTGLLAAARSEAGKLAERAETEADWVRKQARLEAERISEDAGRAQEAARQVAARVRKLAEEDVARLQSTADEDVERLNRTAREEADRLLAAARSQRDEQLKEAADTLARAKAREADAETAMKTAQQTAAEADQQMKRAVDRTERRLERKRLKDAAREERLAARTARREEARQRRHARREGLPTTGERLSRFVKINAERLLAILPITAPMAVAWTGQAGFAEDILGWVTPWTILFAAAFELSTAFVGWMYHQARNDGDAGTLYRVATWIFAMGAAVMNFWHASGEPVPGTRVWDAAASQWTEQVTYWHFTPKAVAFAAMSIVGMVLWELYATLLHRRKLRKDGKVAKARPSIGVVRWVRYPAHSFTAWSLAITDSRLTTLDRAWTAAGDRLADRKAVSKTRRAVRKAVRKADRKADRAGRALHRIVVPRVGADDHGPAAVPSMLVLTRTDQTGPWAYSPVRPVQPARHAVRSGPAERPAVHRAVRTAGDTVRTGEPALALEPGPDRPQGADLRAGSDPGQGVLPTRTSDAPSTPQAADRSGPDNGGGPDRNNGGGPDRSTAGGPDRSSAGGPDRTVIRLTDQEQAALDRLRSRQKPLNRENIAQAVRGQGATIATDRAGMIATALKQNRVG